MGLLQQRIADIQDLQGRMADIRQQALVLQGTLQDRAKEYAGEIRQARQARGLKSFKQAIGVYRVRCNLKLVQQISAYLAAVSERIEFFEEGRERIDFMHRQAQDDLKMVQTLSDMEIAEFISRIDRALATYTAAVNSSLFDIETLKQEKLEAIWETISAVK